MGWSPMPTCGHLLTELPKVEPLEAIEALLPGNFGKDQISIGLTNMSFVNRLRCIFLSCGIFP